MKCFFALLGLTLCAGVLGVPASGPASTNVIEEVRKPMVLPARKLDSRYDISEEAIWTIASEIALWLIDFIPVPGLAELAEIIFGALAPPEPTGDDYWDQIEAKVIELVGNAINDHNMEQIRFFKDNIADLLQRYHEAPIEASENYPNKNMVADSLHTAIVAQRYLIETAENGQALILHLMDISSLHILLLEDVAQTYTIEKESSLWWKDLRGELDHYVTYIEELVEGLAAWRTDKAQCSHLPPSGWCTTWDWLGFDCYDEYTVTDKLSDFVQHCSEVYELPSGDAENCPNFEGTVVDPIEGEKTCNIFTEYREFLERNVTTFFQDYIEMPLDGFKNLITYIDTELPPYSLYHNPMNPEEEIIFGDKPFPL